MRTIVVLLIAALIMTPALAHAQAAPGGAVLALLALPVAFVLLIYGAACLAKKVAGETSCTGPEAASPSHAWTAPAPAVGSDR